ncbi:hypothetical protein WJ974_01445 [Achromobacter xylosoxidans]
MKRGVACVLAVAGLAYPFVVYATLGRVSAAWLALPLALLWLARGLAAGRGGEPGGRLLPLAAVAFCVVLAATNSPDWLRWYPVMVNGMLLVLFGASLHRGRPVVERLARLRHPDLPPPGCATRARSPGSGAAFSPSTARSRRCSPPGAHGAGGPPTTAPSATC